MAAHVLCCSSVLSQRWWCVAGLAPAAYRSVPALQCVLSLGQSAAGHVCVARHEPQQYSQPKRVSFRSARTDRVAAYMHWFASPVSLLAPEWLVSYSQKYYPCKRVATGRSEVHAGAGDHRKTVGNLVLPEISSFEMFGVSRAQQIN